MRGFALFLALTFGLSVLHAAVAYQQAATNVSDMQLAVLALTQRRVIGQDVQAVLSEAVLSAKGQSSQELAVDVVARLVLAEHFLESFYNRQGVDLNVAMGVFSPAEKAEWMAASRSGRMAVCLGCVDAFDLSSEDWLYFSHKRFSFLGAFFSFCDVVAVEAVRF